MANGNCYFYLLGNCISKEYGTGIRLNIDITLAFIAYNFNSPESLETAPSNNGYFLLRQRKRHQIRAVSNFIALIPTLLICQMLAIFSGVEF